MPAEAKMPALPLSIRTWDEGIQAVRGRTSWFVTAVALLAVAIFGGTAIVVRPELSWEENAPRLIVALVLGALGAAGAVVVAYAASRTYLPVMVSLDHLPQTVQQELKAHPESYLPPGSTYENFRQRAKAAWEIAQEREDELSAARLKFAADPSDESGKNAIVLAELRLNGALRRQQQYSDALRAVLDRARYEVVTQERRLPRWVPWMAAFVAASGIGYQLVLSAPTIESASASSSSDGAEMGILVRDTANAANTQLWQTLGLDACRPARAVSPEGVLVVVTSGRGTPEDPYTVTTLPATAISSGCLAMSFSTVDAVAPVVIPAPVKVEITYKSTP